MADLIILGNGFDLAVDMHTSYIHFFDYLTRMNEPGLLASELEGLSFRKPIELSSFFKKYRYLSFWEILFDILRLPDLKEWNNVEKTISETLTKVNSGMWKDKSNNGHEFVNDLLSKFQIRNSNNLLWLYCFFYIYSVSNVYEFLLIELNKFEKKLQIILFSRKHKLQRPTFKK